MRYRSCSAARSRLRRAAMLLVLVVVFLASVCVDGAPVSSTDGESAAQAFLRSETSRSQAYRAAVGVPEGVRIKEEKEFRDPESGDLFGYVFALDPSGYIVMPAETQLVPVIAYSYAGEFPWRESEENSLLSMLRLDLRWRYKALAEKGVSQAARDSNEALWKIYLEADKGAAPRASPTVYGPLLTTEWDQGAPYNDICRWDSVCEGRSFVGCVATALSQIMNYWRYPTEVVFQATDDYTTSTHGFAINAAAASFVGLDYGTGEPSDTDKARLCYAAGVSVQMDYCGDPNVGSAASTYNVAAALAGSWCPSTGISKRWGYESAELRSCNSDYAGWGAPHYASEGEFYSTLSGDMVDALPAQMAIVGTSGGHSIVVDGWQSGGRVFHLNFGWGGSSTGWYSLPEGMPAEFTIVKYAVTNIRPPTPGSAGDVFAFGYNRQGLLGVGDTIDRWTPTKITALPGPAKSVAAGTNHSLVLLENGEVFAFGYNVQGQLGLGDTADRPLPTRIFAAPESVEAVAAGGYRSFLLEGGNVYAFGANGFGSLGLGDTTDRWMPTRITALSGAATAVAGGYQHSLILLENGDVYAFGRNGGGLLGLGDTVDRWIPTKITTLPGRAVSVVAGSYHSFVLLEDGDVYAFGFNGHGALGLGDTADRWTPTRITTLPARAVSVAGGQHHSLILLENGDVYSCGYNEFGQLGLGDGGDYDAYDRWTPTKITTLPGRAASVAAGNFHSLVLLENGDLYAFGWNGYGQLGLGDTVERHSPTRITTLAGVMAVVGGAGHFLTILGSQDPPPPPVPANATASSGSYSERVQVSWSAVSGASSYSVHRASGPNETFVQIMEVTGTSYSDCYVNPGQVYWYRVAACNESGCSALSTSASGYANATASGTPATFRVTSSGDVRADGGFYAGALFLGSADVAEWAPVSEQVEAGDVLELDRARPGSYRLTQTPCSPAVAGVVSTEPGVVLGGTSPIEGTALLALSGIVPVKVTDEGGPIQPGDLLVSSSTPGYAMRWAGPDPCPCALVGKAFESMTGERGVILVLLTAH